MHKSIHTLLIGSFLGSLAPLGEDGSVPQTGTFGQVAPQSGDVRLVDAIPHQDERGGTLQQIVCAAGAPSGFALLWRDHREGMMGLYLGRFDSQGKLREPERPIHQPYAGRRLQPALCLDAQGGGVALWTADYLNLPILYAHAFDAQGEWPAPDQPLSEVPKSPRDPSERAQGVQLPAAAPLDGGGFAVAWTLRGALLWAEVKRDGTRKGEAQRLNPREQQAEPGVQLCGAGKKSPLAVWQAAGHLWSLPLRTPKVQPHDLGNGTLVRAVALEDGSAWLLLDGEQGSSVRRLRADGRPEGEALAIGGENEQALDLALVGSRLALVVQTNGRGRGGRSRAAPAGARYELRCLDPLHPGDAQGIDFLSGQAQIVGAPLVASDGTRLLLAWTDTREGDADIYARLATPDAEPRLGPEFRANTDRASADQINYRVDALGPAGIVTWVDKRDSPPRAYARRIAAPGSFQGDEFLLPGQDPAAAPGPVVPAFRADGSCAFLWSESSGAMRLSVQDASGKSLGDARVLEPAGAHDAALVALPGEEGWLCAWIGSEPAVWSLRVDRQGQPQGAKQRLSRESAHKLGNLALTFLGGRRVLAAWDTDDAGWKLRGRFADQNGAPQGAELELAGSPRGIDWDPALAPAGDGGFLVAWTSGAPDDGMRDVVARFFDARGQESGPLLWISPTTNEQDFPDVARLADGTWAVAWEDDVSGNDHTYVRRIQKDRRTLGPIERINELATKSIKGRVAPRLAAFGDGLLFAFGDRARSLGWDVRVRIVGSKFDAPR